jgi:hypothetical protein
MDDHTDAVPPIPSILLTDCLPTGTRTQVATGDTIA